MAHLVANECAFTSEIATPRHENLEILKTVNLVRPHAGLTLPARRQIVLRKIRAKWTADV
jgi:hypothetical protein